MRIDKFRIGEKCEKSSKIKSLGGVEGNFDDFLFVASCFGHDFGQRLAEEAIVFERGPKICQITSNTKVVALIGQNTFSISF
jgi:hypothetical protein